MALTKYVRTRLEIGDIFDTPSKIACACLDQTYVPPDIQAYVDKLRADGPDPRFAYIHIIAMCDGDKYGSNLNGDVFTEDQLTGMQTEAEAAKNIGHLKDCQVPRFKTFEAAKFYRNHANGAADPHFGDIPCAAWNEHMKRVELIVRIALKAIAELGMNSGADLAEKMKRRGYLTGSMGTRIDFEKCRICGNENEFVHDRCTHLANQMNQILPDGRLVSAENFGCRFFDYSDVDVPAEPGAFQLAKVASFVPVLKLNRVENAADTPRWKVSEIEKHITDPMSELTPVSGTSFDVPPEGDACDHEFQPGEMDEMHAAAGGDVDKVYSTAAASGVTLTPMELAYFTTKAEPDKIASNEFDGFKRLGLDKFDPHVYAVLRPKLAVRSGFLAPMPGTGCEAAKLAELGCEALTGYYQHYRATLSSFSRSSFTKFAQRNPHIRELTSQGNVQNAMRALVYAGRCP